MRYNRLGTSDLRISAFGLGSMTWGEQNSEAEAHAQLDFAFERGVNFVDTAEMYPVPTREATQGRTESCIGSWLSRQPRDRVVLATKVTGPAKHLGWLRGGPRLTPEQMRAALEGSLRRLRTDYVDLYQVHWPERYVPAFGEWRVDPSQDRPQATPILGWWTKARRDTSGCPTRRRGAWPSSSGSRRYRSCRAWSRSRTPTASSTACSSSR
jgi:diketogulonate reductase-like aldo/keto reductase